MNLNDSVTLATSTKQDGNMSFLLGEEETVVQNRKSFLEKHGLHLGDCIVMALEHGDKVTVVDSSDKSNDPKATVVTEALITNDKKTVLFLQVADCLPIVLHDANQGVIALAHLGWRPTEHKLIQKVIKRMSAEYGCDPKNIKAWIGPGIKKESYIFSKLEQSSNVEWQPFLHKLPSGDTSVDVTGFNQLQMLECGLYKENIFIDSTDTALSDNYFSHYRSVRTGEAEGRFATVVALN